MKVAALAVFLLATLCVAQESQEPSLPSKDCMQAMANMVRIRNTETVKASVLEKPLLPQLPPGYTTVLLNVEISILRPGTDLGIEADGQRLSGLSQVVSSGPVGTVMVMVSDSEAEKIRNASELKVTFVL